MSSQEVDLYKNYYQILGLQTYASSQQVKQRYKILQQQFSDNMPEELRIAYLTLSKPTSKVEYDRMLSSGLHYSVFDLYSAEIVDLNTDKKIEEPEEELIPAGIKRHAEESFSSGSGVFYRGMFESDEELRQRIHDELRKAQHAPINNRAALIVFLIAVAAIVNLIVFVNFFMPWR